MARRKTTRRSILSDILVVFFPLLWMGGAALPAFSRHLRVYRSIIHEIHRTYTGYNNNIRVCTPSMSADYPRARAQGVRWSVTVADRRGQPKTHNNNYYCGARGLWRACLAHRKQKVSFTAVMMPRSRDLGWFLTTTTEPLDNRASRQQR